MNNHRKPWTKRDKTLLLKMWLQKLPANYIAIELGRSQVSIYNQIRLMKNKSKDDPNNQGMW